jgi:hypothetical protein
MKKTLLPDHCTDDKSESKRDQAVRAELGFELLCVWHLEVFFVFEGRCGIGI